MKLSYPTTKTIDQVDDYHGTLVADPYRWLEDVDSPETLEWIKQQNELTFGFLEKIPLREHLRQRLTELWDYPKAQAPIKHGGRYFQLRNSWLAKPGCPVCPGKPHRQPPPAAGSQHAFHGRHRST